MREAQFKTFITGVQALKRAMLYPGLQQHTFKIVVEPEYFDDVVVFIKDIADGNYIRPETFSVDHVEVFGVRFERGKRKR